MSEWILRTAPVSALEHLKRCSFIFLCKLYQRKEHRSCCLITVLVVRIRIILYIQHMYMRAMIVFILVHNFLLFFFCWFSFICCYLWNAKTNRPYHLYSFYNMFECLFFVVFIACCIIADCTLLVYKLILVVYTYYDRFVLTNIRKASVIHIYIYQLPINSI